jgi:exosome complex RNA-binding protein Rrp42 (RNase PH superfamily)
MAGPRANKVLVPEWASLFKKRCWVIWVSVLVIDGGSR